METIIGAAIMLVGVLFGAGILFLGLPRIGKSTSDNFVTNYYRSPFEEDGSQDKVDELFVVDETNLDEVLKQLNLHISTREPITSDEELELENVSEVLVDFMNSRREAKFATHA